MDRKGPPSLSRLLAAGSTQLAALTDEARRLESLRQRVLRSLNPDAAPHCLGADLKDGTLTLFMDSAAWTTTLRYQHQMLVAALRASGLPCQQLRLKVLPDPQPGVPPKPAPRELSADTQKLLKSTADGVDDPALAESLRRLARGPKPRS